MTSKVLEDLVARRDDLEGVSESPTTPDMDELTFACGCIIFVREDEEIPAGCPFAICGGDEL